MATKNEIADRFLEAIGEFWDAGMQDVPVQAAFVSAALKEGKGDIRLTVDLTMPHVIVKAHFHPRSNKSTIEVFTIGLDAERLGFRWPRLASEDRPHE